MAPTMPEELKRLTGLGFKADDDSGEFTATFATLNVIDLDGDITVPGAFKDGADVLIGAYQHQMGRLPVGKGVIRADDRRAWVEGKFFTSTRPGADTYATVKEAGGLMEWSYIYDVKAADYGTATPAPGAAPVQVRYLKQIDVFSVDPVLRGAGIGTGTDSIKSVFAEQADAALAAVEALAKRARSLADLRAQDGRTLSAANIDRLTATAEGLKASAAALDALLAGADSPASGVDLVRERMAFDRALATLAGVL